MNRFNLVATGFAAARSAIASFSSLLFLPTADAGIFNQPHHPTSALVSSITTRAEIRQLAQAITVRVLSAHQDGSGILINQQGETYTILTNAHVVNYKGAYRIQTPDGKTHSAIVINRGDSLKGNDLALLQFQAEENYRTVTLALRANLSENQEVFAAGFPYDSKELLISSGKISLLSSQPLVGGYQIGYTNSVQQGMSGGPLLNLEGKLIGVNGLLNKAILNDAYVYQNASQPSTQQLQRLKQYIFAIPIQTLAQVSPNIVGILTKGQNQQQASQPPANNIVDQVNHIAQQITVQIDSKNHGNGSGVIIAHTGQTYYVVTALHVVEKPDSYEIVTTDRQRYALQQQNIIKPKGLDAALLQFTSNKTYSVATIAKYNLFNLGTNNWVFLSGFPGNANGKRKFTAGSLWSKEKVFTRAEDKLNSITDKKYELSYTNLSLHGMSGGPVLDSNGQVVGINEGVDRDDISQTVNLGLSNGVSSSTIVGLATRAGLRPELLTIVTTAPKKLTKVEINSLLHHPLFAVEKPLQNANEKDWLNYGNQLWRLGRYSEAIAALQQAIKLKPEFAQHAYYALAFAFNSQQKYLEAVTALDQATKIQYNYDEAWKIKSEVLVNLEKYPEALAAIDEAIKYNNSFVNYHEEKGLILANLKRYPEAIAALNKAIEIKPLFTSYFLRGAIRQKSKDYQGALFDYNQALILQPNYGLAYQGGCFVRERLKDYQRAIADCDKLINLQPDYAIAYSMRGLIRSELEDYQRAIADFSKVIDLERADENAYRLRGIAREQLKDYQGAIFDYTQAIKLQPNNAFAYLNRGRVRVQLKDYQGAIFDYTQVIKLQPNNADAYLNRVIVRVQLKDYQGAIADCNQRIKLQPNNADAYRFRGAIREQLKDYQGAIFDYNQAIKLEPNNADAYLYRGNIRAQLKDYQGAIADCNQVIKLDSNNADAYFRRGAAYEELKDYRLALLDYNQAIKLQPNNAQYYFDRGVIHHELQDYTAALSDYNQAVAKDEKFWSASVNIGYIKYEKGDVQGAIEQWRQSVKINSNEAEPQMALAVALYAQGEQQKGLSMAQTALHLDKRFANVAFLKQNLWGDRLIADAQKLLSHPKLQAVR